jgi:hypothetical protein
VRRAAIVLLGWGAWLGVLTAVQTPFGPRTIEVEMLGSASAACLVAGAVVWALDARRSRAVRGPEQRLLTDSSVACAVLVSGLALALLGAGFGLWLILIGAGVAALGAGGLAREARARRRALQPRGPR